MAFCPPLPDESLLARTRREFWKEESDGRPCLGIREHWVDADGIPRDDLGCREVDSTACWRRYLGTWEIAGGKFYLNKVEGHIRLSVPGPVFADWFTGMLRINQGRELTYVHVGFGSLYERELHIFVERGIERGRKTIRNKRGERTEAELVRSNLPGRENRFRGDKDFH